MLQNKNYSCPLHHTFPLEKFISGRNVERKSVDLTNLTFVHL